MSKHSTNKKLLLGSALAGLVLSGTGLSVTATPTGSKFFKTADLGIGYKLVQAQPTTAGDPYLKKEMKESQKAAKSESKEAAKTATAETKDATKDAKDKECSHDKKCSADKKCSPDKKCGEGKCGGEKKMDSKKDGAKSCGAGTCG